MCTKGARVGWNDGPWRRGHPIARGPVPLSKPSHRNAEAQQTADQLRVHMAGLASALRAQAEGGQMSPVVRDALAILSREPITAVALRYAELLVDGEIRASRLSGDDSRTRLTPLRTRDALARQRVGLVKRLNAIHQRQLALAHRPHSAPDYLAALVMRHVGGKPFRDALARVLRKHGLQPNAIDVPQGKWWESITRPSPDRTTAEAQLPAEVRHLRRLDDDAFRRVVLADATGMSPADVLAHDALVERWAAHAKTVEEELRQDVERDQQRLERTPRPKRNRAEVERQKRACEAYARASARAMNAAILVQDLRVRALTSYRQLPAQQLRAECLIEAARELAKTEPDLWDRVQRACSAHRARCPRANDPHPCRDCAGPIADVVKRWTGRTRPVPMVEPAPVSGTEALVEPAPEDPASAVDDAPGVRLVCEAALRGLNRDAKPTVVAVETRSDSDAGVFGFAWLTEGGELRTGTERSSGSHNNAIQAICLTILDLDDGTNPIHIVCRDAKAANVVGRALRSGLSHDPVDFFLAGRSRELLITVAKRHKRISVAWDPCPEPHRGAAATRQLADLALLAARGLGSMAAVRAAADRMSQEFSGGAGAELTSPSEEEDDHTWWEPDGGAKRAGLVWHAALYRMHLDGGWCPLPPGRIGQEHDGRRLRLRIDHRDRVHSQPGPEHEVTLRRRGGEWELHGIRWPRDLQPGVIATFTWQTGGSFVTARTTMLSMPERVDGVEFLHRYDARVVTREAAPGSDQDRDVPDLSDASWVLRTLRRLGYLSPDGSATLAEDALARNCLDLGIPKSYLGRLSATVDRLVRAGRIQRAPGSLDGYGRPWYPARSGQVPTELLRYVPTVETLDRSVRREIQDAWHGRRGTHWVTGFVRRLPPGAQASAEQIDLHRQAVEDAEVVDQWLPEGYTYVRRHSRGRSA